MSNIKWKTEPLKNLCKKIGDGIHSTPKYVDKSEYYFINGNNLKDGFITINENTKKVSAEEYKKYYVELNEKTLLMSINGTLGSLALYNGEKVILGKSAAFMNCESIDRAFCYYYLKLDNVQKQLYYEANGSTIKNLSLDSLNKLHIPVPSEDEQQKIAAVLSALDSKIEINNRINTELESMAKTLYDYWFVQFDFPNEDGKPYKTSGGKMVWNEELKRDIPEGWKNGFLSDIGQIIGGSTPSKEIEEYFCDNGMPWITPKDLSINTGKKFISKGEISVSEKGIKVASLNIMPKGTILFSSRAPIGYMAIARNNVTTNQGFKSFVPKESYSTPFVFYTVKNTIPAIINHASGSTFKEISGSVLKTIKICLPLNSIAENYTKNVEAIFEKQNVIELQNQTLADLRDWLLPMLMNGQVKVI